MSVFKKIVNVLAIIVGITFVFAGGTDATIGLGAILIVLGTNNL